MRNLVLLAVFAVWQAIWPIGTLPKGVGHSCGDFSCDEPAISESYIAHKKGDYVSSGPNLLMYSEDDIQFRPACADKSRVLLTAQDGKSWCYEPHH